MSKPYRCSLGSPHHTTGLAHQLEADATASTTATDLDETIEALLDEFEGCTFTPYQQAMLEYVILAGLLVKEARPVIHER